MILKERSSSDGVCSTSGTSSPAGFFTRLGDRPLGTHSVLGPGPVHLAPCRTVPQYPVSWEVKDLEKNFRADS